MKKEYSYGAIIYKIKNNKIYFLIEHMAMGHHSLCKGHIEKGENEAQCAKREIKEETNLDVKLNTNFRYTITYSPKKDTIKDVTFFLAVPTTNKIIVQKEEVTSTSWLEYRNAYLKLTHDSDKEVLENAYKYILKHEKFNHYKDVTSIGELLIDFTSYKTLKNNETLFLRNPGGAPANVIYCLSKLGGNAAFIGKVGNDMHGLYLKEVLEKNFIDTSNLILDNNYFTTLAFVNVDKSGERNFSFARKPGADTMLKKSEVNKNLIKNSKVLHFGSLSLTSSTSKEATFYALDIAKNNDVLVSFDPNYRANLWKNENEARETINSVLDKVDILKISDEECRLLTDKNYLESISYFTKYNIKVILITLGNKGAYLYFKNKGELISSFKPDRIKDTNGAGDSFLGAFLYQMTSNFKDIENYTFDELKSFVKFANATSSLVVENTGAISSMPELKKVIKRLTNK